MASVFQARVPKDRNFSQPVVQTASLRIFPPMYRGATQPAAVSAPATAALLGLGTYSPTSRARKIAIPRFQTAFAARDMNERLVRAIPRRPPAIENSPRMPWKPSARRSAHKRAVTARRRFAQQEVDGAQAALQKDPMAFRESVDDRSVPLRELTVRPNPVEIPARPLKDHFGRPHTNPSEVRCNATRRTCR